ncbi:MAG: BrnT family toxin [Alphaproteobacteria bacterium]|nr:BrnT family toxin [Alphaproteobacteria bacterium]
MPGPCLTRFATNRTAGDTWRRRLNNSGTLSWQTEPRYIAVGLINRRPAFVAFTLRSRNGKRLARPISARYMHAKEAKNYGQEKSTDL